MLHGRKTLKKHFSGAPEIVADYGSRCGKSLDIVASLSTRKVGDLAFYGAFWLLDEIIHVKVGPNYVTDFASKVIAQHLPATAVSLADTFDQIFSHSGGKIGVMWHISQI